MHAPHHTPRIYAGALALVLSLLTAAPVQSATIIDQQQTSQASLNFPVDYWGQTFTPTLNTIVGLDLNFGLAGSYNISIRNTNNSTSFPGTILGQTGFVSLNSGVQHLDFASIIDLTPGNQYLIRVDDSTPAFSGDYYVKGGTGNPYADGTAIDPNYGGNGTFGHDWYFVTYAAPEPARVLLLACGGLLLVFRRRRTSAV